MKNVKDTIGIALFISATALLPISLIAGSISSLAPVEEPALIAFGAMFLLSIGYLIFVYDNTKRVRK